MLSDFQIINLMCRKQNTSISEKHSVSYKHYTAIIYFYRNTLKREEPTARIQKATVVKQVDNQDKD